MNARSTSASANPAPEIASPEALARRHPGQLRLARPPLCPEIELWLAPKLTEFWAALDRAGAQPVALPYWAAAWPGGQALARYLLDHPQAIAGTRVRDLGSGSGIAAIAADRAGARAVLAFETDPQATAAIAANAGRNGARVAVERRDPIGSPDIAGPGDVVLAADLWYERFLGLAVTGWLRALAAAGATVLVADVGRAWFPRSGLEARAQYLLEPAPETERAGECRPCVYRLLP